MNEELDKKVDLYCQGIKPGKATDIDRIRLMTKMKTQLWWDNIFDYKEINAIFSQETSRTVWNIVTSQYETYNINQLDDYVWEEIIDLIEESRQIFIEACYDQKINDIEAHFLSIKFLTLSLKKFRNKFYKNILDTDGDKIYKSTPLKYMINILLKRLETISVNKDYLFSKAAASELMYQFRAESAEALANMLVEETSAILYTKLTI